MSAERYDLAVAGGGIVGLAIAFEAASAGMGVVVLERDEIGAGAAGVAAGMLAPAAEADAGEEALVALAFESCVRYPEFVARVEAASGLPAGYRTEGTLLVAVDRDQAAELDRLAAFQRRAGASVELLSRGEVLEREPNLSPRVVGGLLASGDRQVDPRRLMPALAAAITRLGGEVRTAADVLGVVAGPGGADGLRVRDESGERCIAARAVVLAAGAWLRGIASEAETLPLRPVKGQILRMQGPALIDHVVRTPDVYLVPRAGGELVIGATSEEQGFDTTSTGLGVRTLLDEAVRVLPGVDELELRECRAGLRPALRDHLPLIGPSGTSGLFLAAGHYRHGVMLAPATAALLLETIRTGHIHPLLDPFQTNRFAPTLAVRTS